METHKRTAKNPKVLAKVELAFRMLKRQSGFTKVLYPGLTKNTTHLFSAFAGEFRDLTAVSGLPLRGAAALTPPHGLRIL